MIRSGYGPGTDSLLSSGLLPHIAASFRVDRDAEFDQIDICGDFRRNLVRSRAKGRWSVGGIDQQRVISLPSAAVPDRNLKPHERNLPTAGRDTYPRP